MRKGGGGGGGFRIRERQTERDKVRERSVVAPAIQRQLTGNCREAEYDLSGQVKNRFLSKKRKRSVKGG